VSSNIGALRFRSRTLARSFQPTSLTLFSTQRVGVRREFGGDLAVFESLQGGRVFRSLRKTILLGLLGAVTAKLWPMVQARMRAAKAPGPAARERMDPVLGEIGTGPLASKDAAESGRDASLTG
jgi:hypothetical protein